MRSGPADRRAAAAADGDGTSLPARWAAPLLSIAAFALYAMTAAPGLTWAHFGADGGDLLTAAVVDGVPHPPGYPLYTMLLQNWLAAGAALGTSASVAWLGNLFSATCAALTVGVTALAAYRLSGAIWAATVAALLWAISPLFWGQALITEVYTLHTLAFALLGWAMLGTDARTGLVVPSTGLVVGLGAANHLTFLLLLPAAGYALWRRGVALRVVLNAIAAGLGIGALLYLRIPLAASGGADGPPPVNWGYADNLSGFVWLVTGEAYRGYLFGLPLSDLPLRMAAWARTLVDQFTPVGLGVALVGLAQLDRTRSVWRNVGLLWTLPLSLYAVFYATADSDIYLLPVIWMGALWIAVGLRVLVEWAANLPAAQGITRPVMAALVVVLLLAVGGIAAIRRLPHVSLHADQSAQAYLAEAASIVEPGSLVVTVRDGDTFALWYGAWAAGEPEPLPSLRLVNPSLLPHEWYRRLLREVYPDLPGVGLSFTELVEANRGRVPIYLAEPIDPLGEDQLEQVGPLWRVVE